MMFWDASAIIPLCINEPQTKFVRAFVQEDEAIVAWWGSLVECYSAFSRLRREGFLDASGEDQIRQLIGILSDTWIEIEPGEEVRDIAGRLLMNHPLRAADSLQLAAALVWVGKTPRGDKFICLDRRLREAARKEGFTLLPVEI